ncbi:MAG: hypothetical protein H6861_01790 [Rhodospirillales bacterium]|nr:hypothetical protein [Rhodospirillales bacterium]
MGIDLDTLKDTFSGIGDFFGGETAGVDNKLLAAGTLGILGFMTGSHNRTGLSSLFGGTGKGLKWGLMALIAAFALNYLMGEPNGPEPTATDEYEYTLDAS